MQYRVENKYLITEDKIAYLKTLLEGFASYDSNMDGDSYLIRSIYFDDLYNSCLLDNEGGNDHRSKFRIRTYNNDSSYINLERKSKRNRYTAKETIPLSTYEVSEICFSDRIGAFPSSSYKRLSDSPLLTRFYAELSLRGLSPVNIIEYERTAFVEPVGNVRITFDMNIGYTNEITSFFESSLGCTPILPLGYHILEVKYDELLPDYLTDILRKVSLQKTMFSKYYYSRTPINE